jgi:Protein of unknown function (DUF667)
MPANNTVELGLKQQFLVFQCKIPEGAPLHFEIVAKTTKNDQIRLLVSSAFRDYIPTTFHLQIPLERSFVKNVEQSITYRVGVIYASMLGLF